MYIFGKRKQPTVDTFRERSDDIFSVFTDTMEQCKALNQDIDGLAQQKQAEADKLLQEVKQLESISLRNENLAKKIESFLNS